MYSRVQNLAKIDDGWWVRVPPNIEILFKMWYCGGLVNTNHGQIWRGRARYRFTVLLKNFTPMGEQVGNGMAILSALLRHGDF